MENLERKRAKGEGKENPEALTNIFIIHSNNNFTSAAFERRIYLYYLFAYHLFCIN